ncbi:hypothetical protein EJD97_019161 [Solanum chilense]|uniref:Uncharacterized protein n=1 Tax=Solanum chilense TaxID=4083 RepID=A0A6N2AKI7_SOLCI|nr:hypothetical protein EJD97_019161 [Solanum chilense]
MVLCAYHFKVKLQKAVNFLISTKTKFLFDIISTVFQVGRYMFYEDDLSVLVFISNLFSIFIIFLYLYPFGQHHRMRAKRMMKKIVKRSIYGFLVLLYLKRMFETAYLPFPLPGCVFPLIPAILGACLIVFGYNNRTIIPTTSTNHSTSTAPNEEPDIKLELKPESESESESESGWESDEQGDKEKIL